MMKFRLLCAVMLLKKWLPCLLLAAVFNSSVAGEANLLVLNYHDIIDPATPKSAVDGMDVDITHFKEHLDWLKQNGYQFVSVQQVFEAAAGKQALPPSSVLLSFDDGYESFYTRVFPILRQNHYPATIALEGEWMDGKDLPGKPILTWGQVRELVESGLVEIASHTYDQHKGAMANPQGSKQASIVTHLFNAKTGQYETDVEYENRVRTAMLKSAEFIFQHAGVRPRVMVWPYGEFNNITLAAAHEAGMTMTMGLLDGLNTLADIPALHRMLIADNPDKDQFEDIVIRLRADRALRVAHIDIDYIFDKDPKQTELNLLKVLERIQAMHITTVFLQAYADPDGDGNADALYFPNRHLPVKKDLFSRVAWQLKMVSGVKVYAWMPIMAYQNKSIPADWYVQEWKDGKAQKSSHIYTRLSPFNPAARQYIAEIYEDLAKYCNFDGILFHDDGILSDFEDVSPLALKYNKEVWELPEQFDKLHGTSSMRMRWAEHKTEMINQLTDELTSRVRIYRPNVKTARNIYALPILKPFSEEWYAQSFKSFLDHYDYVAVEAMPFMEEAENPKEWLTQLVDAVSRHRTGFKKTVFELQSMNWKTHEKIAMPVFIEQLELLKKLGVKHLGYYPDNVFEDQPKLADMQQHFSIPTAP